MAMQEALPSNAAAAAQEWSFLFTRHFPKRYIRRLQSHLHEKFVFKEAQNWKNKFSGKQHLDPVVHEHDVRISCNYKVFSMESTPTIVVYMGLQSIHMTLDGMDPHGHEILAEKLDQCPRLHGILYGMMDALESRARYAANISATLDLGKDCKIFVGQKHVIFLRGKMSVEKMENEQKSMKASIWNPSIYMHVAERQNEVLCWTCVCPDFCLD